MGVLGLWAFLSERGIPVGAWNASRIALLIGKVVLNRRYAEVTMLRLEQLAILYLPEQSPLMQKRLLRASCNLNCV